jgi:hypothetical protein
MALGVAMQAWGEKIDPKKACWLMALIMSVMKLLKA